MCSADIVDARRRLDSFLTAVEERGEARSMRESDFVESIVYLLVGNVKEWYDGFEDKPQTWEGVKVKLKRGFMPWFEDSVVMNLKRRRLKDTASIAPW